jgi:hypothetical protein
MLVTEMESAESLFSGSDKNVLVEVATWIRLRLAGKID